MVVGFMFASGAFFVYLGITIQTQLNAEIVETIGDLVPICASCKRIRLTDRSPNDMSSWKPLEAYFGTPTGQSSLTAFAQSARQSSFLISGMTLLPALAVADLATDAQRRLAVPFGDPVPSREVTLVRRRTHFRKRLVDASSDCVG